jgi:Amt family ammonium transporter
LWGGLALGLFADGTYGKGLNGVDHTVRGLFFGGADQFLAQAIGVLTCLIYTLLVAFLGFRLISLITPLRSRPEDELAGLDVAETGTIAYPDFEAAPTA